VQSSLGQHAAFLGRTDEALEYFNYALEAFSRLSDGGKKDLMQTGIYKVIVMMDDKHFSNTNIVNELIALSGDLDIIEMAKTSMPKDKYLHHLALRYLVFRGNDLLQTTYLAQKNLWKCGVGHPWPLIQAYRAIILRSQDHDKALKTIIDGSVLAFEAGQGPTVRLIGACLRAIAHAWGDRWPESASVLDELAGALPEAMDRIGILKKFIAQPYSESDLLAAVLPFNFR